MSTNVCDETFSTSQTCEMLSRAVSVNRQVRSKYLHQAERFTQSGLLVLGNAFRFTAAQEKELGDVLTGFLQMYGAAPIYPAEPLADDGDAETAPLRILRDAARHEAERAALTWPGIAGMAESEGYARIAGALRRMSETEYRHARRFRRLEQELRRDTLFRADSLTTWRCLPCSGMHRDLQPPRTCAVCGGSREGFVRGGKYPFGV